MVFFHAMLLFHGMAWKNAMRVSRTPGRHDPCIAVVITLLAKAQTREPLH